MDYYVRDGHEAMPILSAPPVDFLDSLRLFSMEDLA
jgi:hypothetical protein